jgi:NADH-quinone oxidoreductase subunit M
MDFNLITFLIFIPLAAVLIVLFLPNSKDHLYKYITVAATFLQLILALIVFSKFSFNKDSLKGVNAEADFQLVEKLNWIDVDMGTMGKLSIDYFLGVDGLSIGMVLLSAFILLIGAISSWNIQKNLKGYHVLYLLLATSIIGCFVALDFFLFYLFFELLLLPMFFLIGLWGGERREYASIKFFLYTLAGSIFILIVMVGLYFSVIDPAETAVTAGFVTDIAQVNQQVIENVQQSLAEGKINNPSKVHTFNMLYMMDIKNYVPGSIFHTASGIFLFGNSVRILAFLLLFVGFAIKLPVVPFHTWLPDAHVEAPTPVSVLLAALLLKVGAYGILRVAYSIFPEGALHFAWLIGLVGVVSIIYGAFNALAMKDIKKLIAYSSVSHMGFVLLGIASVTVEGINGALFQMFSHGILSALLFLIVGVLYDRTSDRLIENYRGLASKMPNYTVIVTITFFASLGLPGFSGFIAELFILLGAFNSDTANGLLPMWMAVMACAGILLGAVYYLWTLQKMFFGKFWARDMTHWTKLKDLDRRELFMLVPLVIITIVLGLFPGLFFDAVSPSASKFVEFIIDAGKSNLDLIKQ